ncbi:MAG TPA: hypothetical protein DDZ97_04975 [Deltaproteobacteria bacterium]|nr:hypothetical protein [Deltaproteobacteria bacterium]
MRGNAKLKSFLTFSAQNKPSSTTEVVSPLPVKRGFLDLFWSMVICKRARVFRLHDFWQQETKKP